MGVYTVSADPQSLSELIEKLADGLPQTNTVRRLPAKLVECRTLWGKPEGDTYS